MALLIGGLTSAIAIPLALLMGVNFVLLGFLGTYIGQVFERVQGHPAYLVERHVGTRFPHEHRKSES